MLGLQKVCIKIVRLIFARLNFDCQITVSLSLGVWLNLTQLWFELCLTELWFRFEVIKLGWQQSSFLIIEVALTFALL